MKERFIMRKNDIDDLIKEIGDLVDNLCKARQHSLEDLKHARKRLKKYFLPFWRDQTRKKGTSAMEKDDQGAVKGRVAPGKGDAGKDD